LENKLPVFNSRSTTNAVETVNSVYAESCNPPTALGTGRGSYFNGKDAVVNIHNFAVNHKHSVEMYTKVEVGGGTLSIFDADIFTGYYHHAPDCTCG